jgi:crotonobetainyl-CoA:carnitine CoA-transferase CaiB-like acyl-CoA transferase
MSALEGIRVIDASSFLAGPYAAMALGDLGADVLKVEPPLGDPYRRFGRQHNGHGVPFANANRNKRSVVLDLRDGAERAIFDDLLGRADILITNGRPGATQRLSLNDDLIEQQPRLIWVRITGFGPDGPHADAPAFDSIIQARTGLAVAQGEEGAPKLMTPWVCDKVTAMFATQAALGALVARTRTGRGQLVDVPMLDTMAYFNFPDLMVERTLLNDGPEDTRDVRQLSMRPVRTADGWIVVNLVVGRQISAALAALGLEDRKAQLRALTDPAQLSRALCEVVEEGTRTRSTNECLDLLAAHDVPAGPIFDLDEHLSDSQVAHNEIYEVVSDPRLGQVRQPRYPARSLRGSEDGPAPGLDEHRATAIAGWPWNS